MLAPINALFGGALLLMGRKFFWLFIGVLGFITGAQFTTTFVDEPEWLVIAIGLVFGLTFALFAAFLQAIAIWVAGFLSGAYVLSALAAMAGFEGSGSSWVIYVVGGAIGMLLVTFLLDWAIITLSSLAGASLVMGALPFTGINARFIFFILFIFGVLFQGSILRREKAGKVAD